MGRGRAAAVLGGIGFAAISINSCFHLLPWDRWGYAHIQYLPWLGILSLVGLATVFAGLLCIRREETAAQAPPLQTLPVGNAFIGATEPRRRPGWALAIVWIVMSAMSWILGLVFLGLVIEAGSYWNNSETEAIVAVLIMGLVLGVPAAIVFLIWLYQAWDAVAPQHRTITPGQAVGFCFIPFFNFYWIFRALPGLSASIRRARAGAEGRPAGGAGYGMGIAACIVVVIPYVSMLAWPLVAVWVILANKAKNRMLEEQQTAHAPVAEA